MQHPGEGRERHPRQHEGNEHQEQDTGPPEDARRVLRRHELLREVDGRGRPGGRITDGGDATAERVGQRTTLLGQHRAGIGLGGRRAGGRGRRSVGGQGGGAREEEEGGGGQDDKTRSRSHEGDCCTDR